MRTKKIPNKIKALAFLAGAGLSIYAGPIIDINKDKETQKKDYIEQNIIKSTEKNIKNNFYNNFNIEDYVNAIIKIESNGDAKASRYEPHLNDTSYGLGQLLTSTAKGLEKKYPYLPRLGNTQEEIKKNLCDEKINKQYTTAYFKELLEIYKEDEFAPELAVAAYNSGPTKPRNALYQRLLNKGLYNQNTSKRIIEDGVIGTLTKEKIKEFQSEYDLNCTGELNQETLYEMNRVVRDFGEEDYKRIGIIPINRYTPNHVNKFKKTLESFLN